MSSNSKTHFFGLDIIRIVAALMVVMNHFAQFSKVETIWSPPVGDAAFPFLGFLAGVGAVGVEIFFVISGFVIAMSLASTAPVDFLKHRVLRILPALWICSLIALAVRAANGDAMAELATAFLRSAVLFPMGPYIDGVAWSLVVEAVFYGLIFAVMFFKPPQSLESVAKGLGTISIAYLAIFAVAAFFRQDPLLGQVFHLFERFPFKVFLLRHGVFFALGILLYLRFIENSACSWKALPPLLICFGIVEIALTAQIEGGSTFGAIALWLAGLAAIVTSVVSGSRQKMRPSGSLYRLIRKLGLVSYPLYLTHFAIGLVIVPSLFSLGLGRIPALLIALTIIFSMSWLIMEGPEAALRDFLRQYLFRPSIKTQPQGPNIT